MITLHRIFQLLFAWSILNAGALTAQDEHTILGKVDQVVYAPKDKQAKVRMILIDKSGKEKIREADMFQKGIEKRLYRYTYPESQAGMATLSLPGDVMWLYMPSFEEPQKITMLAKSGAFTGTDFSYEDMESKTYSDRFVPKLSGSTETEFVLDLTPKSDKSVYSRIILHVHRINFYPLTMEYFDRQNRKIKEATYIYKKIGQYWNAEEVTMKDLRKNHQTTILMSDVKFDQGLADDIFTVEKMIQ